MAEPFWHNVARKPRHAAAEEAPLNVEVQRAANKSPALVEAKLVDLSRDGLGLRVTVPLAKREAIIVRLQETESQLDATLTGVVQWCRPEEDGSWSLGCKVSGPVDWETLGGLFLDGILATDAPGP